MIVVAIIGILAAVAIPAYNRSLVTAAIEEGLIFAEEERMRIELFFEENNRLPSDATEAGLIKFNQYSLYNAKCQYGFGIKSLRA